MQTAILLTVDGLTTKQVAALIEKIELEAGKNLATLEHREFDPEEGGVVINQLRIRRAS